MKNYNLKYSREHIEEKRDYYRKYTNTGNKGTEETILFYGYKEPLKRIKNGFGYDGVLSYSKNKEMVQCHICGRLFRALGTHLKKCHEMNGHEYKERFNLCSGTALVGEATREKMIEKSHNISPKMLKMAIKKNKENFKNRGYFLKRKMSLELKNKRGNCPDQLLDMIDKVSKSIGRAPSIEEFCKFGNGQYGKFIYTIYRTFGTWRKALKKLNMKPPTLQGRRYSDEELLSHIKDFYGINKRSPRASDMRRGLLPGYKTYNERFGSLNKVRLLANVPIVVESGYRKWDEWMPTEEQRKRMLKKY